MELVGVPRLLMGSLMLRPYVFGFLLLHLLGASACLGWRRTAVFTLGTWSVALVAEHSSIRTGIPFGWYFYIPRTADRELWIAGVPFFDSLSFPFLLVASYGLAWFLQAGCSEGRIGPEGDAAAPEIWPRPGRVRHLVLTSLLFVLIDVVIDPVALRGDRWFLGHLYGYPEPGLYFGVSLANFLGWGVVGATATGLYHWLERRLFETPVGRERRLPVTVPGRFAGRALLCPGVYFIVLAFNLAVTVALGEWGLLLSGVAMTLPVLLWTASILGGRRAAAGWWRAAGPRA